MSSAWLIATLLLPDQAYAQLTIDDHSYSQTQLIQKLVGKGVKISNIQFNCPYNSSQPPPYGYFEDNTGTLEIEAGLIMTTGAAINALGPNDDSGGQKGQNNGHCDDKEDELSMLLTTEKRLCDACKIEFDVTVEADLLVFNYVFGSEEYLEYKASYHDVFGFFISGPGITGEKNLAVLPNSNIPVDVHTVNDSANTIYYINNGTGAFPNLNLDLQYDGYTKVLVASAKVIPCQTYHLKLVIADVKDGIWDSGVFLQNKSFQSIQSFTSKVIYEHPQFKTAIEGCNKAYIVFKRITKDNSQPLLISYLIAGAAKNGMDYTTISQSIAIPQGKDSAFVTIDPLTDGVKDAGEDVLLLIKSACPNLPPQDTIQVIINEYFTYKMAGKKMCEFQSVLLNESPDNRYTFQWGASPYLSCTACPSPTARPVATGYFNYAVTDTASGCMAHDSLMVEILKQPLADFSFAENPDFTSLDIDFKNLSVNANDFIWDFGDGSTSAENSPTHHYSPPNPQVENEYDVTLISKWKGFVCSDTVVKKLLLNPLFIPNLITVNDDGKNENFIVKGIKSGVWHLFIYNRWGGLVYRSNGYDNKWTGENTSSGIYYYLLQSKGKEMHGWIEVIK